MYPFTVHSGAEHEGEPTCGLSYVLYMELLDPLRWVGHGGGHQSQSSLLFAFSNYCVLSFTVNCACQESVHDHRTHIYSSEHQWGSQPCFYLLFSGENSLIPVHINIWNQLCGRGLGWCLGPHPDPKSDAEESEPQVHHGSTTGRNLWDVCYYVACINYIFYTM